MARSGEEALDDTALKERALRELGDAATTIQPKGTSTVDDVELPASVRGGLVLLERYELLEVIAEGGMATVWKGQDRNLKRPVAIKFTTRFDESAINRFHQEALLTAQLGNPHIVQIFDVGTHEGVPFMIMELLEGETLAGRLLSQGPLRATEAVSVFSQVAQALGQAHEAGIIHRDLKPSNIFLCADEVRNAVVLDFGVAKNPEQSYTRAGDFVGTPHYMSIEQALDPRSVDNRSDLFSLALVVFEAMVGERAFGGKTTAEVLRRIALEDPPTPTEHGQVPPELDTWFKKAAHRDPEERFQTAAEFIEGLRGALLEKVSRAYSRRTDPPEEVPMTRPPATVSVAPIAPAPPTTNEGSEEKTTPEPIGEAEEDSVEESLRSVLPPPTPSKTWFIVGAALLLILVFLASRL